MENDPPRPPEMPPEALQPAPKKKRTKLYIGVTLALILVISVLLVGFFIKPFNVSIDYGPLNPYVQQLKDKGFEVSQGTWKNPQYYAEIPDLENFIKWAETAREQHRQRGEDDPIVYVDIQSSVFWFIGRIAMFNYDDVTFYWFV